MIFAANLTNEAMFFQNSGWVRLIASRDEEFYAQVQIEKDQGIDVTFPFCWYKVPYTLMENNENKDRLVLEKVFYTWYL